MDDEASYTGLSKVIYLTPAFSTFTVTFTLSQIPSATLHLRIGGDNTADWKAGDWIEINYFQLERGTKPSDWSLAPEDIQEQFLTLKAATR